LASIQQQLEMLQSHPSLGELAEKTVDYAKAKAVYFDALRAAGEHRDRQRTKGSRDG
jgi:hypothetical protein